MHPTQTTLSDQAVAQWWDDLQVYQRAQWLHDHNYRNINAAQFRWAHLTWREQSDIWILRQRETHQTKETHDTRL